VAVETWREGMRPEKDLVFNTMALKQFASLFAFPNRQAGLSSSPICEQVRL
jgi:hypothetical protein